MAYTSTRCEKRLLHGSLNETVYMYQPMGFCNTQHPNHVCLLKCSLYGLKQAPRAWYQRFTDFVATIGFIHSKCEHSLFVYHKDIDIAYLLIYVDDIILTTSSSILRDHLIKLLAEEFAMKELGPLSSFLGISVTRNSSGLFLDQQAYARDITAREDLVQHNPFSTPVDILGKQSASMDKPYSKLTPYRSLASALQYLTFTRPDICYALKQVCLHMHSPHEAQIHSLKRIIRYIKGTLSLGLHILKTTNSSIVSYTDADWADCPDTRRSTFGYCVYLGDKLISWSSNLQEIVSRSSAKEEYRGVANVVAETCWLRNLLLELHDPITKATLVFCDNVSAIYLSGNPVQYQGTKYIELDIHFIREKVARGQVRVMHVPTQF
ncbi:uncharacterized mitochondrial protein AtMg00810-like [Rutidosis leptorrhynchoides]|uniref:uncharacterized mitochondrial protein AtMg00810-like n=1 Tax=Rutidosis leptorrhynchoides TaxID=125765 RepID=UPI003A999AED